MNAKITFVLCAQALFIQLAFSQVIPVNSFDNFGSILSLGNALGSASSVLGANTVSAVSGAPNVGVVSGTPLLVTSVSPIGPSGIAVASENVIEGVLAVNGQLPFLSAVAFEGALPTSGSGVATCGCGNGQVGITSEGLPSAPGYARF